MYIGTITNIYMYVLFLSATSHYYNAGEGINDKARVYSQKQYRCTGAEASLHFCRYSYLRGKSCSIHNPVGLVCSTQLPKPIIVLAASVNQSQSQLTNVIFANISTIQVCTLYISVVKQVKFKTN